MTGSEDVISVLTNRLYSMDPIMRKDAAIGILSVSQGASIGAMVGRSDVRELAAKELTRSGGIPDIPLLAKVYDQALREATESLDDLVSYRATRVQRDVIGALFGILKRCDTLEKVEAFEGKMSEAILQANPASICTLGEIKDAADVRRWQIRREVLSEGTVRPPKTMEKALQRSRLTR